MPSVTGAALALCAAFAFGGCSLLHLDSRFPALPECPGELVPVDRIAGSFLLRQHLRITSDTLDVGLRLITEKRSDGLTLVGFTTLGMKAFTLVQRGTTARVTSPLGPVWPVPPVNVLRDLHRARFLAVPGAPFDDGEVHTDRHGVAITERWQGGRLVTRTLVRPGDAAADAVRIEFGTNAVRIHNGWCGYDATIVTAVAEEG